MGVIFSIFSRPKTRIALEQELSQLDKQITHLEEQEAVLQNSRRKWLYLLVLISFVRALQAFFAFRINFFRHFCFAYVYCQHARLDIVAYCVRRVLSQGDTLDASGSRGKTVVLCPDRRCRISVSGTRRDL